MNSTSQPVKAKKETVTEGGKTTIYSLIEVPNSAGKELPNTGGTGTTLYTLVGTMLVALGVVALVRRRRVLA